MNVDGLSIDHCSAQRPTPAHRSNFLGSADRERSVRRRKPKLVAFHTPNLRIVCLTQPRRIFGDHVQHRLNIRRRAGDDTQNFTRRGLLFQRFLEFVEQPHVFDGDDGLVGEGFKQFDLRRGEGTHFGATRT